MSVYPLQSTLFNPFLSEFSTDCCPMDWKETPEAHIFRFDLPGRTKEDVKLQVHNNQVLHISAAVAEGCRKDQGDDMHQQGKCKWHCKERISTGNFRRDFRLPENAAINQIKASMRDGVLVVTVPKNDKLKKEKIKHKTAVEISGFDGKNDDASPKGLGRFVCCKA